MDGESLPGAISQEVNSHVFRLFFRGTAYFAEWANILLMRVLSWTQSVEFTHMLNVPPDFHIEYSVLNMHLWLILQKLDEFKTKESNLMIRCLNQTFEKYTSMRVNDIHLKKKNDFINDLKTFMRLNRNTYDVHFKKSSRTSKDPYYKADALIWSTVYFEKIDRYDHDNYLMAEYLIENFNMLKGCTLEEIETMTFVWFSPFYKKPSPTPHAEIIAKNPPLTKEEFNAELDSPNPVKKFFYTYKETDEEYAEYEERVRQLPLHAESN